MKLKFNSKFSSRGIQPDFFSKKKEKRKKKASLVQRQTKPNKMRLTRICVWFIALNETNAIESCAKIMHSDRIRLAFGTGTFENGK